MNIAARFRTDVEQRFKARPLKTARGEVLAKTASALLGSPVGRHEIPPAWAYRDRQSDLEMIFQFYANFTDNDLICKVCEPRGYSKSSKGASLQFNSSYSIKPMHSTIALVHHGLVTVGTRLRRAALVELIDAAAPAAKALLRLPNHEFSWPIVIGTSNQVEELIDRLFLYAYCIEQAKRSYRGEERLPVLGDSILAASPMDEPRAMPLRRRRHSS